MDLQDERGAAFRRLLRSPWALLLAATLAIGPLVAGVSLLGPSMNFFGAGADASESLLTGPGGFPSLYVAIVLVLMVATGALGPSSRPVAAFVGRGAALAVLVGAAWAAPLAALLLWSASWSALVPALLAFLVAMLESLAFLALAMLFAELGAARGALAGGAMVAAAFYLVPLLALGALSLATGAGAAPEVFLWETRLAFLTPTGAADALRSALFPASVFWLDETTRLDHPVLFSPALWFGTLAAWILLPVAMLLRVTANDPPTDEESPAA